LSREVREAITRGEFRIWAAQDIDEAIEVVADAEPGISDAKGEYPADSFNGRVRRELLRMARSAKAYLS